VRRELSPSVSPFCDYQKTTQIGVPFAIDISPVPSCPVRKPGHGKCAFWICFWIYGEFSVSFSAAAFAIPTNFHFYFLHLWSIAPLSLLLRSRASQDARCGQDGTVSFGTNGFIALQAFDALQLLMRIRCGVRQVLRSCHSVIIKRRRRSEFFFPSTFLSYLPVLYGSQGKFERICAFCHFPEFGNATSFPFLSCDFHYPDEFSFTFSAHLRTSRQDSFFCATFLLHVFILDYINGPGEMSPEIVLRSPLVVFVFRTWR